VVRGEARRGRKSLLNLASLEIELERRLRRKGDVLACNSIRPLLKESVLKEEVKVDQN
jgi:predicted nucleotidyltransferase